MDVMLHGPPGSTFRCEQPGCGRSVDTREFGTSFIRLRAPSTPEREEDVESRVMASHHAAAPPETPYSRVVDALESPRR